MNWSISAHKGEQLAAMLLEFIQWLERIRHVRNVSRPVLRNLRVSGKRDLRPIEVAIVLIPMELGHSQREGRRSVEDEEVAAAVKSEPDLVVTDIARSVPNLVDGSRFGRRQAGRRRRGRSAADVGGCAEFARPWVIDDAIDYPVSRVASLDCRFLDLDKFRRGRLPRQ